MRSLLSVSNVTHQINFWQNIIRNTETIFVPWMINNILHCTGGSKGAPRDFLNFMQFFKNLAKSHVCPSPPEGWHPLLWGILDPPLHCELLHPYNDVTRHHKTFVLSVRGLRWWQRRNDVRSLPKQECIPVGCVLTAHWPYPRVCSPGGCVLPEGGACPRGVRASQGGCMPAGGQGGCLLPGGSASGGWYPSMHWAYPPLWTESQTRVKTWPWPQIPVFVHLLKRSEQRNGASW